MTERVLAIAREHCEGRLACLLEGGYHLRALADSAALHIETLLADGL
jgi:acetoin utilization deacetylase AcuC-like enzyme